MRKRYQMDDRNLLERLFNQKNDDPPLICVEMSGNHQGSLKSAIEFAKSAKEAGADLLKLQVYTPETITLKSKLDDFQISSNEDWCEFGTLYDLYEKAHTPWEWIEELFHLSRQINLPVWATPFDKTAVRLLEDLDCPFYKIASPEITDLPLIEACAQTGKPVVLSTGLASKSDLDEATTIIKKCDVPYMILKCVSAYPTPIDDMNLASIPWLRETYNCAVGLSDHTIGPEAAYAATALGAKMIEKHFRLPGDSVSVDASFSMPLDALEKLKNAIFAIHSSLGTATLEVPECAKPSLKGRRSLYVVKNISAGERFTEDNVRSIRPSFGLEPKYLNEILGRRATKDILAGERMSWDLIKERDI